MKLPIIVAPDPRLRQVAKPVEQVDDEIRALLEDMLAIMYEAPGIGLAAVQLGIPKRLVVMDIAGKDEPKAPMRLVNPEIIWKSDTTTVYEEGCLSIPNIYEEVERPAAVRARYQDETGATHEIEATGLLATCLQHEIDHLDGVLFVDYLSKLKRDMILRRLTKLKRQGVYSS